MMTDIMTYSGTTRNLLPIYIKFQGFLGSYIGNMLSFDIPSSHQRSSEVFWVHTAGALMVNTW